MAFIMSAGMVDPRQGRTLNDRQPMAIIQSWGPTSKLWWDLGLRWHPDLAVSWLKGGGQFTVAEIVDEPPEELTVTRAAEEVLDLISEQNPEYAQAIKDIAAGGTAEEKNAALKQFEGQIKEILKIADFVKGQTQ